MSRHTPSPVQLFTSNELSALREIRQQVGMLTQCIDVMMEADAEVDSTHQGLQDLKAAHAEYHVEQLKRTLAKARSVAMKARITVFHALEKYIGAVDPSEAMDSLYRMDPETHYRVMCLMADPSIR